MELGGLLHVAALAEDIPQLDDGIEVAGIFAHGALEVPHRRLAFAGDHGVEPELIGGRARGCATGASSRQSDQKPEDQRRADGNGDNGH